MKISIILPTRKRNNQLKRLISSICDTAYDISNIEVCIYYDYDENYQSYKKIGTIISKEDFNLKMFDTTSEHAKEYGLNAKKPLYLQSFSINENKRLNGIGNAVIKYINDYAIKNKNDIIFGHIPQNADFTKDSRESFLPNIDMIKYWLKDKGYTINNDNNDFYKILNNSETLKE